METRHTYSSTLVTDVGHAYGDRRLTLEQTHHRPQNEEVGMTVESLILRSRLQVV